MSTSTENKTPSKTADKEELNIYTCVNVKYWVCMKDRAPGHIVVPVPYT